MALKLSDYYVATPPFFDEKDTRSKRVVFATRSAEVRLIDDEEWQSIRAGRFDDLATETFADLVAAELLVPSGENELSTILGRNSYAAEMDDTLSLVIMPTASCQLGCGYCGQDHTRRWLSAEHQDDFLGQAAMQLFNGDFRHLFIRWFGAEPLSGIGVIRSITPRLQSLAKAFDCTYGARIVTNGLALTAKVATELVTQHGVNIIDITLDGPAEYHDARRFQKNGQPTFDRIFSNLVSVARADLDVQIKVRTNVDESNFAGVVPLLRLLAAEGIQNRVQYYVAPIHSWGNDANTTALPPKEFAAKEIEWFCEMFRLGFLPGLIPTIKPVVCMAVQAKGLLVDATGTLFNCTEVPYVPAYGTPNRFAIGTVTDGEVEGRRNLLSGFNDRIAREEYPCSSCRMLPVCGGACPKAWLEGYEPCPSALHNIEERLVLAAAMALRAERQAD
jgi:uncharacterized protein